MKVVSGNGASLSTGALGGKPGVGAPLLGTLKDMLKKVLETGVSLSIEAPLGNLERGLFIVDLERRMKESSRDV